MVPVYLHWFYNVFAEYSGWRALSQHYMRIKSENVQKRIAEKLNSKSSDGSASGRQEMEHELDTVNDNDTKHELDEQLAAARALVPFVLSAALVPYEGYLGSTALVPLVDADSGDSRSSLRAVAAKALIYFRVVWRRLCALASYAKASAYAAPGAFVRWLAFL